MSQINWHGASQWMPLIVLYCRLLFSFSISKTSGWMTLLIGLIVGLKRNMFKNKIDIKTHPYVLQCSSKWRETGANIIFCVQRCGKCCRRSSRRSREPSPAPNTCQRWDSHKWGHVTHSQRVRRGPISMGVPARGALRKGRAGPVLGGEVSWAGPWKMIKTNLERYSVCSEWFWVSRRKAIDVREIMGRDYSDPRELRV